MGAVVSGDLATPPLNADSPGFPRRSERWISCVLRAQTSWRKLPDETLWTIGRDRGTELVIDEPSVSRHHARLTVSSTKVIIEDLKSRNGTRVNSRRIEEPTAVGPGDWVAVGGALLGFHLLALQRVADRRLLGPEEFIERMREEMDRCNRFDRSVAVVKFAIEAPDIDGPVAEREFLETVGRHMRSADVLGQCGGALFSVILPEAGFDAAQSWVAKVRNDCQMMGKTVSAEISVHPSCGPKAARSGRDDHARATTLPGTQAATRLVAESANMRRVCALVDRAAAANINVLLLGETGVGKDVVAEAIHNLSHRKSKPFVTVNCTAIPDSLFEGELFGVERGAFTGSDRPRPGLIEQAAGGTLLLDEVGDLPRAIQPKLLRALQEKTVRRLGGAVTRPVDFRLIAATNRTLQTMVESGEFRQDLFFRLSAFTIPIPPLRERVEDLPALVLIAVRQAATSMSRPIPYVQDSVIEKLKTRSWPGNVRELFNAVERALVLDDSPVLGEEAFADLLEPVSERRPVSGLPAPGDGPMSERSLIETLEADRKAMLDALRQCGGNQSRAAELLAMPRRTFVYRMRRFGIRRDWY